MFCREQAAHFEADKSAFDALGVRLVAIGNGNALMARDFVEQFRITFEVFTDPARNLYQAAGMVYARGFKLGTLSHGLRALTRGHLQGRTKGDALQQGGVLLVDTEGAIRYAHRDGGPGEHVPPATVLAALRKLDLATS